VVCKLLKVVARDGHQQHYSLPIIPLNDVYLDPRGEVRLCKSVV